MQGRETAVPDNARESVMTTRFRSIFISDVHLGTPDCQATYLLDFLRSTRSEFLYLVGDIIDLEALALRSYWPASHAAIVAEILAIAARGTQVVYIPGNHDASFRSLCGQQIGGVFVRRNDEHVGADGRRYRVSHGDEFDPAHIGRDWLTWIGEYSHRGLRWCNRRFNGLRRQLRLPYLPLAIIAKSRIAAALAYIGDFERRVSSDCAATGFDGHICGHIHYGNIRRIGTTLYLNDGDWVEHCTALTEDEHGAMRLLHWSEHRTELALTGNERLLPVPASPMAFASLSPERVANARATERLVA